MFKLVQSRILWVFIGLLVMSSCNNSIYSHISGNWYVAPPEAICSDSLCEKYTFDTLTFLRAEDLTENSSYPYFEFNIDRKEIKSRLIPNDLSTPQDETFKYTINKKVKILEMTRTNGELIDYIIFDFEGDKLKLVKM